MAQTLHATTRMWYIAHSNQGIFHYGDIESGQELVTGQTVLETFATEEEWTARKVALGVMDENQT